MSTSIQAKPSTLKGFGLVRDGEGNPLFTDYNNIPEVFLPMLSEADLTYIKEQKNGDNPFKPNP